MVIDDLADRIHDCDLLLDQNLFAEMAHRYDGKVPEKCGLMMGPDYALLQPQYAELHPRITLREGPVRRVFVYFGGADTDNVTGRTIAAFLALGKVDVVLDVVINPASPHAVSIRQQAAEQAQINLHEGVPSLASLMMEADLAVGAGGATSWERCCLGLPALVVTLAGNQTTTTAEQHERGLVRWLGYKDEVSQTKLAKAMTDLFDAGLPAAWSKRCSQEVDGKGTERANCQIARSIS
jgi:UDP-2,4-diacetamido-2,4,6-trideoxy-beta-L-altropyranose hydrolase